MRCATRARSLLRATLVALAAACVKTAAPPPPEAPSPTPDTLVPKVVPESVPQEPIEDVNAPPEPTMQGHGRVVRIALAAGVPRVTVGATGEWKLYDSDGASTLLHGTGGDDWIVDAERGGLRASRTDGAPTPVRPAPFVVRSLVRGAFVTVNGKKYRGELAIYPAPGGVTVVNRVYLEDYLRGVVPLEIGRRAEEERAAVDAQAIAARSYAYTHLAPDPARPYDMLATVLDQVYGGVDAETDLSDRAVQATVGLVLTYHGRIVNAPYFSSCGGSTAAASEVWHEGDEPYLVAVSDRVPGTIDRFYCDISPSFRWTRTFTRAALAQALDRYLRTYAATRGAIGAPRGMVIESRTMSGRVGTLAIETERGAYRLRGNDIRFVLRSAGGEILASTYFSVDTERDDDGRLARVILRGTGNGHGIGMCQWGAIGRARAGQDYRTILRTYYPGTTIATVAP